MSRTDLISKRTRNAFREVMVDWTLAEIRTLFDNEGFLPDYEFAPDVTGQRRTLIEQIYHSVDWTDHRNVSRVLGVYQTVVAIMRRIAPDTAVDLLENLRRDEIGTAGPSFTLPARIHSALQPLSAFATSMTADQLHTLIERINASIDTDPALAIGTAKELLETTCKTILADLGEEIGNLDLSDLVKAASKQLKLVPDGVPNEAKGAGAIKKTLRSLAAVVAGLGEMRNLYGSGHGQDGRARGLTARHARLAVGAASTLALFLFDTHQVRKS